MSLWNPHQLKLTFLVLYGRIQYLPALAPRILLSIIIEK